MADEISIVVRAEDSFSSVLGNFGNIMTGLKSTIDLVSGAIRGAVDFTSQFIDEASQSEDAIMNLNTTLRSTKDASGMSSQALLDLASSFQAVTRFSDETIINGEAMLLTFTNIGKDVFPQATEAMLNLAQKFGSVDAAAVQLGKALNDPINGVTALRRVGVQLNDTQEEQIKKFVEAGDIMSAQKIILGELETEFGGLAVAMGGTFQGQLDILKNKFSDLKEGIGGLLIYALQPLLDMIGPNSQLGIAWDILNSSLATVVDYLNKGVPPFQAFGLVIMEISNNPALANIATWLKDIGGALLDAQRTLDSGGTVFDAIKTGLEDLSIAWANSPLGPLVDELLKLVSIAETQGIGPALSTAFSDAWTYIAPVIDTLFANIFNAMENKINEWIASGGPDRVFNKLGDAFNRTIATPEFQSKVDTAMQGLVDAVKRAAIKIGDKLEVAGTDAMRNFWNGLEVGGTDAVRNFFNGIEVSVTNAIRNWFNNVEINVTDWVRDKIVNPIKRFLGIASPSTVFLQIGKDIIQGLINGISSMLSGITDVIKTVLAKMLDPLKPILDFLGLDFSGILGTSSTGTVGGRSPDTNDTRSGYSEGGGLATGTGMGTVVNYNFYGPTTITNAPADGSYDCPPNPIIVSGSNQIIPIGVH